MGKRLVITEKPSVARDISAALGGFTDHDEYFESDDYVITWAVGHLLELAQPQEYDKKWGSWAITNLPILPETFMVRPKEGQKKRLDAIEKLGTRKDIDGLINACDAGREGELIYRRLVDYAGINDLPQQRLWLQSMTKDSIRAAFNQLRPGKELDGLADAAFCRSVGDWLVGMNATRALTQRLKSRGEKDAWSAGRVQTPTLYLLVLREREILAHIPRSYWEIAANFNHGAQTWEARYWDPESKPAKDDEEDSDPQAKPSRLFDRARVDRILEALAKNKTGEASEKRRKSKQNPPLLFDLTALQREANRRFSFSAKRTLDAAQRLYEAHKLLTYPRTDSKYLPGDYGPKIQEVLAGLQKATDWRVLAKEIAAAPLNLDKILDDTKVSDHFAIIPTGNVPEGTLKGDDERIFELVVRQFLAAMMGPATWSNVERIVGIPLPAEGKLPAETARFRITARNLEDPGFHRALGTAVEASALPALVAGQDTANGVVVSRLEFRDEAKDTKPPGRYSEAQLLRMMETAGERVEDEDLSEAMKGRGLGTPATRADTIEGLVRKMYARRVDGRLGPTSKAMQMMDVVERAQVGTLCSPKMTGEWEFGLGEIQHGRLSRAEWMTKLVEFTKEMTTALVSFNRDELYAKEPDLGVCPSCKQGKVVETPWSYLCSRNERTGAVCDFIIWKDRAGRYIDRGLAARLVAEGKVGPISGFVDRSGRTMEATLTLERDPVKDNKWGLRVEYGDGGTEDGPEVVGEPFGVCPMHEGCRLIETTRRYVCEQLLKGETRVGPILPRVVCQREISMEEANAFFGEAAKTDVLEKFISRKGRPFKGMLIRKETGKHGFEFPARAGEVEGAPKRGRGRKGAVEAESTEAKVEKVPKKAASKGAEKASGKAASKPTAAKTAKASTKTATAKPATKVDATAGKAGAEKAKGKGVAGIPTSPKKIAAAAAKAESEKKPAAIRRSAKPMDVV